MEHVMSNMSNIGTKLQTLLSVGFLNTYTFILNYHVRNCIPCVTEGFMLFSSAKSSKFFKNIQSRLFRGEINSNPD